MEDRETHGVLARDLDARIRRACGRVREPLSLPHVALDLYWLGAYNSLMVKTLRCPIHCILRVLFS